MPVYLVVFNAHPADDSDREKHQAELRAGGFRSIIERRFSADARRQLAATCYLVDTAESMATLSAFSEHADELLVVALAGPLVGRSPDSADTHAWLASRLPR
jgi:hypothetical protein